MTEKTINLLRAIRPLSTQGYRLLFDSPLALSAVATDMSLDLFSIPAE